MASTILILYLVSYVICYYLIKRIVTGKYGFVEKECWDWADVRACALLSLTIWAGVILSLLACTTNDNKKPPKWL